MTSPDCGRAHRVTDLFIMLHKVIPDLSMVDLHLVRALAEAEVTLRGGKRETNEVQYLPQHKCMTKQTTSRASFYVIG